MEAKKGGRRRFLSGALAGLMVGGTRSESGQALGAQTPEVPSGDLLAYGERSRFETSKRTSQGSFSWLFNRRPDLLTPLQDSLGIITPPSLHYEVSHGSQPPDIDPSRYRLTIQGLVDRPRSFTLDELKRQPFVSRIRFLECAGNTTSHLRQAQNAETVQLSHGFTSCSEWTGVPLSLLLQKTGVQEGAGWLVAEGAEAGKHIRSIPLEKARKDVIVAYGQNGEPLRPENGYPLRLVVPGLAGFYSVKWLRRIKLSDQPHLVHQGRFRHSPSQDDSGGFRFEIGPKSVITFPSGGQRLPSRGFFMIGGLAWSGGGAIRTVEVSSDGGRSWKEAQLQDPVLPIAHTRFSFAWNWHGEEAILQSRCTDELGQVQPTLAEFARSKGVTREQLLSGSIREVGHFNVIQPWKVTRDGSVHNALT